MDCRRANEMIPRYVAGELDDKKLKDFLEHVEKCPKCYRELETEYMVSETLHYLEDPRSDVSNLSRNLRKRIDNEEKSLKMKDLRLWLLVALLTFLIIIAIGFFSRIGDEELKWFRVISHFFY